MRTQRMRARFHKNTIYMLFSMLGGLLLSLQLVLPAPAFAASPRATSGYTFGTSKPLDLASVAVVRLAGSTNPSGTAKTSQPCFSGVGAIVSSNSQQDNFLNYVLTDGSLLTCGSTTVPFAITIYANNAYTNSTTAFVLAQVTCANDLSACTTTSSTLSTSTPTVCQNPACHTGGILLPFVTTDPQPFLSPTSSPIAPTFHLKLGNASAAVLPQQAATPANLLPVASNQQGSDSSATPTSTATTQFYELGTPIVDTNGNLVSIHTSTADTVFPAGNIPLSPTNVLQAKWQTDVTDFYTKNYASVSANAASIGTINPRFLAATGLKTVADHLQTPKATAPPNNNNNTPGVAQNTNGFFGIPYWLLAVVGLILVILLLMLVSLIVTRRRRELARFEREQEAAGRTADLEVQRIRMNEAARRISGPMPAQPAQAGQAVQAGPVGSAPFASTAPAQPVLMDLRCPNCGFPYNKGDGFCSQCRAVLVPSDSGYHVRMVQPPPPAPFPPAPNIQPQSPVLMPSPSIENMPTIEQSPSQRALADETTAPGPLRVPSFNGHNMSIMAGSRSDPGIKRKQKPNEDSLLAVMGERTHNSLPQQFGLFVVADGMGGHANGQDASRLAIQTMVDRILPKLSSSEDLDDKALVQLLVDGVKQANMAVYERNMEHHADMGTTMTSAIVIGGMAYVANVGDSRTYMYREPVGLHKITHDHSVVASLVEAGIIKNEDIYTHPKRNQIYRSLGEKSDLEVDSFVEPLQPGDKLLLCSDGLWEMVRDRDTQREQDIQRILSVPNAEPKQTANALINAANNGGGEDNITAIVVSVSEATTRTGMTGIHVFDKPETVKIPQV